MAAAQTPRSEHPRDSAAASNPFAFELVSIRQNVSHNPDSIAIMPDGFRAIDKSLAQLILMAYVPTQGEALFWDPVGFPDWVRKDRYDVIARVPEANWAEWQKPQAQTAMLRSMLQSMLVDRCHLAVHRELKDAPVYYLTVGKDGPKFKPSASADPYPAGENPRFPGGGLVEFDGHIQHFLHAPMTLLASYLTNMNLGGRPVQDHTGLTGRYDFSLQFGWTGGLGTTPGEASDPGPSLFSATETLGLKLIPANGQVETLVLDHIDRPSEN